MSEEEEKTLIASSQRALRRRKNDVGKDPSKWMDGVIFVGEKWDGHQKLTDMEENILCGMLFFCHHQGVSLTQKFVRNIALKSFPRYESFGEDWFKGFRKRHGELFLFQSQQSMSRGRRDPTTYEQTLLFIETFGKVLDSFRASSWEVHASALVNFDETLIRAGVKNGKESLELIPRGEATGSDRVPNGVVGALLTFVTADGSVPLLYVCMKHKSSKTSRLTAPLFPERRASRNLKNPDIWKVHYSTSESGYVNEGHILEAFELFGEIMQHHMRLRAAEYPVVLLGDNLRQHRTLPALEKCMEWSIHLQMLPPNSSHYLQPLDNIPFAIFKRSLEKSVNGLSSSHLLLSTRSPTSPTTACISSAFMTAFTPAHIMKAWENVGLWPFAPDIIKKHAL